MTARRRNPTDQVEVAGCPTPRHEDQPPKLTVDQEAQDLFNWIIDREKQRRELTEDESVIEICAFRTNEQRRILIELLAEIAKEYAPHGTHENEKNLFREFRPILSAISDSTVNKLLFALLKLLNRHGDLQLKCYTRLRDKVWAFRHIQMKANRQRKGPQIKHQRVLERNTIIAQKLADNWEPKDILRYLQEHHLALVKKLKSEESMMRVFRNTSPRTDE